MIDPRDLSQALRPPRWRVFRYRHWKRHHQPDQVTEAMIRALTGDVPPLNHLGVKFTNPPPPRRRHR